MPSSIGLAQGPIAPVTTGHLVVMVHSIHKMVHLKFVLWILSVTLPELPRPRDIDIGAQEDDEDLTDFQIELIQAAAVIKGDHIKDIYPLKLAENMKVFHAAKYVEEAFTRFHSESKKAKEEGRDEHEIVDLSKGSTRHSNPKSFIEKLFSCLICDN